MTFSLRSSQDLGGQVHWVINATKLFFASHLGNCSDFWNWATCTEMFVLYRSVGVITVEWCTKCENSLSYSRKLGSLYLKVSHESALASIDFIWCMFVLNASKSCHCSLSKNRLYRIAPSCVDLIDNDLISLNLLLQSIKRHWTWSSTSTSSTTSASRKTTTTTTVPMSRSKVTSTTASKTLKTIMTLTSLTQTSTTKMSKFWKKFYSRNSGRNPVKANFKMSVVDQPKPEASFDAALTLIALSPIKLSRQFVLIRKEFSASFREEFLTRAPFLDT